MVFDPYLFFNLIRSEKSNSWSLRAVLAHEFAHQLQVWRNDPVLYKEKNKRPFVRDKELQADCAAAAILTRVHREGNYEKDANEKNMPFEDALRNAFASIGDFELGALEGHHGTAYERALMVPVGQRIAADILAKKDQSATAILQACGDYINAMNKKFADDLWPIGSKL